MTKEVNYKKFPFFNSLNLFSKNFFVIKIYLLCGTKNDLFDIFSTFKKHNLTCQHSISKMYITKKKTSFLGTLYRNNAVGVTYQLLMICSYISLTPKFWSHKVQAQKRKQTFCRKIPNVSACWEWLHTAALPHSQ